MCPYATPDHNGHYCYDNPTAAVQNCGPFVSNNLCNGCEEDSYFGNIDAWGSVRKASTFRFPECAQVTSALAAKPSATASNYERSMPKCVRAVLNSGLGNWLYIAVEVALVGIASNADIMLPLVLHNAFHLPQEIGIADKEAHNCTSITSMQAASNDANVRHILHKRSNKPFVHTRAQTFKWLFANARMTTTTRIGAAVHIRTVSDERCSTYTNMRDCPGACIRKAVLLCVVQWLRKQHIIGNVMVLSDARDVARRFMELCQLQNVSHVIDESVLVDASNHTALSRESATNALYLWTVFAMAPIRVASSISTFSKSALLSMRGRNDMLVDTRCHKKHRSDGPIYSCHRARVSDLV